MRKKSFKNKIIIQFALRLFLIFNIAGSLIGISFKTKAQGSLLVIPKRVVFEGSKRTQELNLGNSSNDTTVYEISIIEMRMKVDGSFEEIKQADTGQAFASGHLRLFPRHVTLAPNEAQTIKVQLVNSSKMAPGEYRSHILFKPIPQMPPGYKKPTKVYSSLSLTMIPVFAITIPVIIRIGPYSAILSISDLKFRMEKTDYSNKQFIPRLYGRLNRTGAMSVYGNISIEHIDPDGIETHIAMVRGVSVYLPNAIRDFHLDLGNNLGINYQRGKLRVRFTTQVEERAVKLAEAELSLE